MTASRIAVPASWRRSIHPRRGGARVAYAPVTSAVPDWADARADLRLSLDAELADAAPATPLGAAAVAAILLWSRRAPTFDQRAIADGWIAGMGLEFAAVAGVELAGLRPATVRCDRPNCTGRHTTVARRLDAADAQNGTGDIEKVLGQIRTALAAAPDDRHAATITALAALRDGILAQRFAASFLAPEQSAWVDADARALATDGRRHPHAPLLMAAAHTTAQAMLIRPQIHSVGWRLLRGTAMLHTIAEALGDGILDVHQGWHRWDWGSATEQRTLMLALAAIPTDRAFQALLDAVDVRGAQAAVEAAAERFPARAMRLLSSAASPEAPKVAELLRRHVVRHPALAPAPLPTPPTTLPPAATTPAPQATTPPFTSATPRLPPRRPQPPHPRPRPPPCRSHPPHPRQPRCRLQPPHPRPRPPPRRSHPPHPRQPRCRLQPPHPALDHHPAVHIRRTPANHAAACNRHTPALDHHPAVHIRRTPANHAAACNRHTPALDHHPAARNRHTRRTPAPDHHPAARNRRAPAHDDRPAARNRHTPAHHDHTSTRLDHRPVPHGTGPGHRPAIRSLRPSCRPTTHSTGRDHRSAARRPAPGRGPATHRAGHGGGPGPGRRPATHGSGPGHRPATRMGGPGHRRPAHGTRPGPRPAIHSLRPSRRPTTHSTGPGSRSAARRPGHGRRRAAGRGGPGRRGCPAGGVGCAAVDGAACGGEAGRARAASLRRRACCDLAAR
ncbi:hypothetical protein OHA72_55545 [Dactylosporangium sp. NBC_01737]|uniref:hypothetical protein n=1 Tax=Dactylosporangium sp. NBC_01737 TaxID=2975959 RepID=UPI002E0D13AB|nr:hypothetical protein OHA72_55545 [Dactylosporangium sp. NBC_01737]